MATKAPPDRDRLQPALLDRLLDDEPDAGDLRPGGDAASNTVRPDKDTLVRALTRQQLRAAVLRDLTWLLNSVQPPDLRPEQHPHVAASVLNYGLPPLSGSQASSLDVATLEQNVRQAILRFEPRILPDSLHVRALEDIGAFDHHNQIALEITGLLWSQPVPLEVMIRTELDLETGQVDVRDSLGAAG